MENIKGKINELSTYYTDAYGIAVANGFKGTVAEWLDSLVGKSAYDIAVMQGFKGTEKEWIASLKADADRAEAAVAEAVADAETAATEANASADEAKAAAAEAEASVVEAEAIKEQTAKYHGMKEVGSVTLEFRTSDECYTLHTTRNGKHHLIDEPIELSADCGYDYELENPISHDDFQDVLNILKCNLVKIRFRVLDEYAQTAMYLPKVLHEDIVTNTTFTVFDDMDLNEKIPENTLVLVTNVESAGSYDARTNKWYIKLSSKIAELFSYHFDLAIGRQGGYYIDFIGYN